MIKFSTKGSQFDVAIIKKKIIIIKFGPFYNWGETFLQKGRNYL